MESNRYFTQLGSNSYVSEYRLWDNQKVEDRLEQALSRVAKVDPIISSDSEPIQQLKAINAYPEYLQVSNSGQELAALTSEEDYLGLTEDEIDSMWEELREYEELGEAHSEYTTTLQIFNQQWGWQVISEQMSNCADCLKLVETGSSVVALAGTFTGALVWVDLKTGDFRKSPLPFNGPIISIVPDNLGQTAFVTGLDNNNNRSTYLVDIATGIVLFEFRINNNSVQRVAFDKSKNIIVAATVDSQLWWIKLPPK